jgi:hypothetical protein
MSFLHSLTIGLIELAALLGKWLFIVTAPILLCVTGSYYQAGRSIVEPIAGLILVSGISAATYWLSLKLDQIHVHDPRNVLNDFGVTIGRTSGEAEPWKLHLEEGGRKQVASKEEARRANQRQAELWRQANPWGGFNPYE